MSKAQAECPGCEGCPARRLARNPWQRPAGAGGALREGRRLQVDEIRLLHGVRHSSREGRDAFARRKTRLHTYQSPRRFRASVNPMAWSTSRTRLPVSRCGSRGGLSLVFLDVAWPVFALTGFAPEPGFLPLTRASSAKYIFTTPALLSICRDGASSRWRKHMQRSSFFCLRRRISSCCSLIILSVSPCNSGDFLWSFRNSLMPCCSFSILRRLFSKP